jgi:hypothetical protein
MRSDWRKLSGITFLVCFANIAAELIEARRIADPAKPRRSRVSFDIAWNTAMRQN